MAGGLLAILGKPKAPTLEEKSPSGGGGGLEREYAREAFSALRDDDEEGFISAFLGAVKACVRKSGASEYEDEAAIDEE